jgi:hypothetical protein
LQNCWTSPPTTDDDILIHRTAPPSIRTSSKSASSTAQTPVVDLTQGSSSDIDLGDDVHQCHGKISSSEKMTLNSPVRSSAVQHYIDLNADDPFDEDDEGAPYTGPEREEELMAALWSMMQSPPIGPITRSDLEWTPVLFQDKGTYKVHDVAVVQWSRLEDFRTGEASNPTFPCKFLKDVRRVRKAGSLAVPRANSVSRVERYVIRIPHIVKVFPHCQYICFF